MKRIITTGVVSAIAAVSFAGTASAAPAGDNVKACFGQVHKAVNAGFATGNVGLLVQSFDDKGQGKNTLARGLAPTFCSTPE